MRGVLIDWMIDVSVRFQMSDKVIFYAVDLLDRHMSGERVSSDNYQLIGTTCLMIFGKLFDLYPPLLENYVDICDEAYS